MKVRNGLKSSDYTAMIAISCNDDENNCAETHLRGGDASAFVVPS